MKIFSRYLSILAFGSFIAVAAPIGATAVLNGGTFLQSGQVTNTAVSANIVSFVYSLGTPDDNIATWDTGTGGGTASDFLSDPRYFQTVTFGGLNIAPGAIFNFAGLDIDLIVTLLPLNVTGAVLDTVGLSLRNASLSVVYDDGQTASAALLQTPWATSQTLTLGGTNGEIPEPSSFLLIAGGAVALMIGRRFR